MWALFRCDFFSDLITSKFLHASTMGAPHSRAWAQSAQFVAHIGSLDRCKGTSEVKRLPLPGPVGASFETWSPLLAPCPLRPVFSSLLLLPNAPTIFILLLFLILFFFRCLLRNYCCSMPSCSQDKRISGWWRTFFVGDAKTLRSVPGGFVQLLPIRH